MATLHPRGEAGGSAGHGGGRRNTTSSAQHGSVNRQRYPIMTEFEQTVLTDLGVLKERSETLEHRLFGNGQPGVVGDHEARLRDLEEQATSEKVRSHTLRVLWHSASGFLGAALAVVVDWLLH